MPMSSSSSSSVVKMAASLNQDDAHSNVSSRSNLKRPRSHNSAAAAAVTKFKGVVPQISGHWGAQIYANHQRVWLGTFKSEKEAAMAYDSAAIKLRSGDSHRNFPWSPLSLQEPVFQKHCTTEAVLCMIKDGSYATKFSEFLNQQTQADQSGDRDTENNNTASSARSLFLENINNMMKMRTRVNGMEKFSCRKLFRKELTPSDVGKLNRLVIPKKFAVKYFPVIISDQARAHGGGLDNDKDVLLSFYDPLVRLWKFRYCYWKSSQSFVFTRGWNKFVKEKELKAKDVITFFLCEGDEGVENENSSVTDRKPSSSFYVMDVSYSAEKNEEEKEDDGDLIEDDEQKHVEENADSKTSHLSEIEVAEEKEADGCGSKKKSFRLFGVDILQN